MRPVRSLARFRVTVEALGETCVIRASGDLDLSTAGPLGSALDAARADGVMTLLDLSAVSFIDSGGLRVLLRAADAEDAHHWSWSIVQASSAVWRLAELTGTTSRLPLGSPPESPERLTAIRSAGRELAGSWASA